MTDPNEPDSPSTGPPSEESSKPYISSRLREKLMESDGDDWSPKSGSPITGIIIGVVVLAALVGGVMYMRSAARAQKIKEDAAAAAAARADSLATIARAESLTVAARSDSMARAVADSVARKQGKLPKAATAGATGSTGGAKAGSPGAGAGAGASAGGGAATPPAAKADGFGIAVGTFMDESRAKSELDRLSGTTSLSGIVAPTSDGGFRVILGKYGSRGAADKKATALADSGLVREARVVPRPK